MLIVTSLPPYRPHIEYCLSTWKYHGHQILAVQEQIQPGYPGVLQVMGQESELFPPYPSISSVFNIGLQYAARQNTQGTGGCRPKICVLNADIEMLHQLPETESACIIRWNYNSWRCQASREQYGIDGIITSKPIPDCPLAIGRPWWDYWIIEQLNNPQWFGDKILYHKDHDINWNTDHWNQGMAWYNQTYGTNYKSGLESAEIRRRYPFSDMDKVECKFLNGGFCHIVEQLSGITYQPPPENCRACRRCQPPQDVNEITKACADWLLKKQGLPPLHYGEGGPGTRLKKMLSWFVDVDPTCNCESRVALMNAWGNERCRANKATILGWLRDSAHQRDIYYPELAMSSALEIITRL